MRSDAIIEGMKTRIAGVDPNGPRTIFGIFQLNITTTDKIHSWIIDLKNLKVSEGTASAPDATITVFDDDLVLLCTKKLTVDDAFASGKLKIAGDTALANALLSKMST